MSRLAVFILVDQRKLFFIFEHKMFYQK